MRETIAQKTVKVSVEVRSGTARFRVGVQARSIREALDLVPKRYPEGDRIIDFPIEPGGFFVREPAASAAIGGSGYAPAEAA